MTQLQAISFFDASSAGSTFYYATQFLPIDKRDSIRNLLQLFAHLESSWDIRDAETRNKKLRWWSEEISHAFEKSASHPVTQRLQQDIWLYNLPKEYLLEIVDGFSQSDCFHEIPDTSDRDLFLQRTGGLPALLLAEIGGYKDHNTPKIAQILGSQLRYTWLLRTLKKQYNSGLVFLTDEEMSLSGMTRQQLGEPVTHPELSALVGKQLEDTCQQMRASIPYIPARDFPALLPVLVAAGIELALCKELQKDGYKIMEGHTELTAIRKLWISWRTRRKAIKGRIPV